MDAVDAAACDRWVPGPEVLPAPTGLFLSVLDSPEWADLRLDYLGRRMSARCIRLPECDDQALLELLNGVVDSAVPVQPRIHPARCAVWLARNLRV